MQIKTNGNISNINIGSIPDDREIIFSSSSISPITKSTLGIKLSGLTIKNTVVTSPISQPEIIDSEKLGYVSTSSYAVSDGFVEPHVSTSWIISSTLDKATAGNGDIANVAKSTSYLTDFPNSLLNYGGTYFVKAKHHSASYDSDWSIVKEVSITDKYIQTPTITLVDSNILAATLSPVLTITAFRAEGFTDTLKAITVLVSEDSNFTYGVPYTVTTPTITLEALTPGTEYFVKAKMLGETLESEWSDVISFTTMFKTEKPVITGDTSGYENNVVVITITNYNPELLYSISLTGGTSEQDGDKINWKLPVVNTTIDTYTETHTLQVVALNLKDSLGLSDITSHDVLVMNIPASVDYLFNYPTVMVNGFHSAVSGMNKFITTKTIDQPESDTPFVSVRDIICVENAVTILDPLRRSFGPTTIFNYNESVYIPKAGDILFTDTSAMLYVLSVDIENKTFTVNNEVAVYSKIFKPASMNIGIDTATIVRASYVDGLLQTYYGELVVEETYSLTLIVETLTGNTVMNVSGSICKKAV